MIKRINLKTALVSTLILILNSQTSFATFSDIPETHTHFEAISYLEDNNVLHGYPDETFKPENNVNRAEFLKIVLEGTNIPLNVSAQTPFDDVDNNAWYAPYIRKAYDAGWVIGYSDGTFKPEQTINKVEALKIVGEVQNWELETSILERPFEDTPLSAWFTKYVAHAKNHQYLEETGTNFAPSELMTRASISEVIYKTLISGDIEDIEEENTNETTTTSNNEAETNLSPHNFELTSQTFFENISLDQELPNRFYKNEIYILEGNIESGTYDTATAFIDPEDNDDSNYITFSGKVTNNHFQIPVFFPETGNFNIGLLAGDNGETKLVKTSVMNFLPESSNTTTANAPDSLNIDFAMDTTFINFNADSSTLKKLHLIQGDKEVIYYSRQNNDNIPVRYIDFKNFNEESVSYYLETADINSEAPLTITSDFESSITKSFIATEHTFDSILADKISAGPPDLLDSIATISFNGQVKTDSQYTAYIIKPDGFVEDIDLSTTSQTITYFGNTTLTEGSDFQFSYTPTKKGRYIIEINNKEGLPILNHPVYIGGMIPLIPDFFDLNTREFYPNGINVEELRNELIDLLNESRQAHGISPISMNNDLNDLAQSHSDDMAVNHYFSHVNNENQTPEDRRISMNIPTTVSENIARDVSIKFGHFGLLRSAAHRSNILEQEWTRVGLGISQDDEGYLIIAQEFSTDELSDNDLITFKNELYQEIDNLRSDVNINSLTSSLTLEQISIQLNNQVINDAITLDNTVFEQALSNNNINGSSQAIGRTYNLWSTILTSILEEETAILQGTWNSIGIDVQTDPNGIIHALIIINNS